MVLAVSCSSFLRDVVAIPQSGLLAQVSLLWLCVRHSGKNLTKHCCPRLLHLPAQPPFASVGCMCLRCFSTGGVTVGLVGFNYLFIFPSCYVALCASKALLRLGSESVSWSLETSLLKIPFPGQSSFPTSFVSFFIFYIFSYLFLKTMICFSGCLMSSASIQKLFCGIYSALKFSFDEFVRKNVVSTSYSSAILGPPKGLFELWENHWSSS